MNLDVKGFLKLQLILNPIRFPELDSLHRPKICLKFPSAFCVPYYSLKLSYDILWKASPEPSYPALK